MSKKVFISHAVKDKEIADAFVDVILHGGLSVLINEIFCVSTDGTKIKSGEDWRDSIKENILSAKVNFLLISSNYKESEVCMNEMGAAWMTDSVVLPLIIDPINYKTVGVIQEPNQIEKLLDEKSLDRIRDIVQDELKINPSLIKSDRWTSKKKEFLLRVKKHISNNPFPIPMDRIAFNDLIKEKADLEKAIEGLIDEKTELDQLVEDLKKAKDKQDVSSVLKKRRKTKQYDEFIELCQEVKYLLDKHESIINGIIFKDYANKDIQITTDRNRKALDEALADDYIDEDLDVKWDSTKEMRSIQNALNKLSKFLSGDLSEDFQDSYDENFDVSLDIRNRKFWEEAFEANISFN